MGFCSEAEYDAFIRTVPVFERMLREAGIFIIKYYLDIDRAEQKKRLAARRGDPLKRWKISPIDQHAIETLRRLQQSPRRHAAAHRQRCRALDHRARRP